MPARPISIKCNSSYGLYDYQNYIKDLNTGQAVDSAQYGETIALGLAGNFPIGKIDIGFSLFYESGYISGSDLSITPAKQNYVDNELAMSERDLLLNIKFVADDLKIGPVFGTKYKYNYFSNISDQFVYSGTNIVWTMSTLEAYDKDRIYTIGAVCGLPLGKAENKLEATLAYDYNVKHSSDSSIVLQMDWQNSYVSPAVTFDIKQDFSRIYRQKYRLMAGPLSFDWSKFGPYIEFRVDSAREKAVPNTYGISLGSFFQLDIDN